MKKIYMVCIAISIIALSVFGIYHLVQPNDNSNPNEVDNANTDSSEGILQYVPFNGMGNELGYYFIETGKLNAEGVSYGNIKYIDYASKQVIYLSDQPNAQHDDPSSPSYLDTGLTDYHLYVTNENVYLIANQTSFGAVDIIEHGVNTSPDISFGSTIHRMDLDGSNRETVFTSDSGSQLQHYPYIGYGNYLFAVMQKIDETEQNEDGFVYFDSSNFIDQTLVKIDLDTGTYEEIMPMDVDIVGVDGMKIIYQENFIPEIDTEDFATLARETTSVYKSYDVDTGEIEEIFADKNIMHGQIYNGKMYYAYHNERGIYQVDLVTKESTLLTDNHPLTNTFYISNVSDDALLITYIENKHLNPEVEQAYIFDLQTKEFRPFDLITNKPREIIPVLEEWENQYLVITNYITTDEYIASVGVVQTNVIDREYALITKEDYWRGTPNYTSIDSNID